MFVFLNGYTTPLIVEEKSYTAAFVFGLGFAFISLISTIPITILQRKLSNEKLASLEVIPTSDLSNATTSAEDSARSEEPVLHVKKKKRCGTSIIFEELRSLSGQVWLICFAILFFYSATSPIGTFTSDLLQTKFKLSSVLAGEF